MGNKQQTKNTITMKAISKLSTFTALSSTLTWAKGLNDLVRDAIYTDKLDDGENVCGDNNYCSRTGHYCGDWSGAKLRRIPAWGAEVSFKN